MSVTSSPSFGSLAVEGKASCSQSLLLRENPENLLLPEPALAHRLLGYGLLWLRMGDLKGAGQVSLCPM